MRLAMASCRFASDRRVYELARALAALGVKVTAVTAKTAPEPRAELPAAVAVEALDSGSPFAFFRSALRYFLRHTAAFDAVWAPAGCPAASAAVLGARLGRVPAAVRVGTSGEDEIVGFWRLWAFRRSLRFSPWIVTDDPKLVRRVVPKARVRVVEILDGVDAAAFSPLSEQGKAVRRRELGLDPSGLVFVCPVPEGLDASPVLKAWSSADVGKATLAVVGAGSAEPGRGVRLLGPKADPAKAFQAADAAVFLPGAPPRAILEAMAAGLAVLAASDRRSLELVEDAKTGHTYEPAYPEQLRARLQEFASKPGRLAQFGDEARAQVLKNRAYERIATRYVELFEGVRARRLLPRAAL